MTYKNFLVRPGFLSSELVTRERQNDKVIILTEHLKHLLELSVVIVSETALRSDVND